MKYLKRLILGVKGVIFGVSTLDRVVINSKHGNYNNKCMLIVENPILRLLNGICLYEHI